MISIVGCDHGHQRKAQSCGGQGLEAFEREQKRQFVEAIEKIIVRLVLRWSARKSTRARIPI
jgi:hypothetical protein